MLDDCVFCTRREQPPILFETRSLYAMPDKFPLRPGHVLIITKEHIRCYGAAPLELLAELDAAAARVRRFLRDAYGESAVISETGVTGQTVFHAHLHLIPMPRFDLPADFSGHPDVRPISGWQEVRTHFDEHGQYYYLEVDDSRYLVSSTYSPVLREMRALVAKTLGATLGERGIVKTTIPEDVHSAVSRYRIWSRDRDHSDDEDRSGQHVEHNRQCG